MVVDDANAGGASETSPLLINIQNASSHSIEILPLRYVDIVKATRTGYEAFLTGARVRYFNAVDTVPMRKQRQRIRMSATLADNIYAHKTYCISHGDAFIAIGLTRGKRGPFGRIVSPVMDWFQSSELAQRKREYISKARDLLRSAFGDQIKEMIEIRGLATAPDKQGRGYARALVDVANDMGDAQGRAIYAVTSEGHGFYQAVGYVVVQEGFVGVDNPAWDGPLVGIRIMYRAPKSRRSSSSAEDSPTL
ncbi:hypothetical protein BD413DRAFT_258654 [Trametes elegans]|nr:hypothetical protein BD413DRAFT_258654 [Trametes elegans]